MGAPCGTDAGWRRPGDSRRACGCPAHTRLNPVVAALEAANPEHVRTIVPRVMHDIERDAA